MTSSCRICLSPNTFKDISSLPIDLQVESSVQDVFRFCLSIEMTEDTSDYNRLCSSCHSSIICFYTFKELALKSDSYLKSLKCSEDQEVPEEVVSGNEDVKLEFGEVVVKEEELYDVDILLQDDEADVFEEYATGVKEEPPDEIDAEASNPKHHTKKLPCQICGCLFVNMTYLDRHIVRIHHKEKQFFCGNCSAGYHLQEALEMHTRREHFASYPCRYCKKLYKKGSLKMHIQTMHAKSLKKQKVLTKLPKEYKYFKVTQHTSQRGLKKEPRLYPCDTCDKKLSSAAALRRHHRYVHLMEKNECPFCHKKVQSLTLHINYTHGEKPYACKECPMKYAKLRLLKIHEGKHCELRPFPCPTCGMAFKNKYCLDNHVRSVHKGERMFLCQVCSKKFFKRYHLDRHMSSHESKPPRTASSQMKVKETSELKVDSVEHASSDQNHNPLMMLPCEYCAEPFENAAGLEKHMCIHMTEKQFFCNDCDSGFYVKLALEMHIRKDHLQEPLQTQTEQTSDVCPTCGKSFKHLARHMLIHQRQLTNAHQCKLCSKSFTTKIGLERHHQRVHERVRFRCKVCDKEVARLKEHMLHMHSERSFPCPHCELTFASDRILRAHITSHSTERPFECPQCGNRYKNKIALDRHTRSVHIGEKKFLCQICSKGFFQKDHFDRHLSSHSDEYKYRCEVCDKAIKTADGLRTHMQRHQGVKNFECDVCGLGFVNSASFKAHKLTHTNEKKHACRICGVLYKRTSHRNRHEVTVHGKSGKPLAVEGLKHESDDDS